MVREDPAKTKLFNLAICSMSSGLAVIMTESPLICDYLTLARYKTLESICGSRITDRIRGDVDRRLVAVLGLRTSRKRRRMMHEPRDPTIISENIPS